jgi:hypothetical protein
MTGPTGLVGPTGIAGTSVTGPQGPTGIFSATAGTAGISFTVSNIPTGATGTLGIANTRPLWLTGFQQTDTAAISVISAYIQQGPTDWYAGVRSTFLNPSGTASANYIIYYNYVP